MTLGDWLASKNISDQEFAGRLGVSRMSVWRYRTGAIVPDKDMLNLIFKETDGEVTANDFVHSPRVSVEGAREPSAA